MSWRFLDGWIVHTFSIRCTHTPTRGTMIPGRQCMILSLDHSCFITSTSHWLLEDMQAQESVSVSPSASPSWTSEIPGIILSHENILSLIVCIRNRCVWIECGQSSLPDTWSLSVFSPRGYASCAPPWHLAELRILLGSISYRNDPTIRKR